MGLVLLAVHAELHGARACLERLRCCASPASPSSTQVRTGGRCDVLGECEVGVQSTDQSGIGACAWEQGVTYHSGLGACAWEQGVTYQSGLGAGESEEEFVKTLKAAEVAECTLVAVGYCRWWPRLLSHLYLGFW